LLGFAAGRWREQSLASPDIPRFFMGLLGGHATACRFSLVES